MLDKERENLERKLREQNETAVRKPVEIQKPLTQSAPSHESNVEDEPMPEKANEEKKNDKGENEEMVPEEEDVHGTKSIKDDFNAKMLALEAEMSAGKSKLAKLRERIRKAKGAVKEADEALADTKKS